MAAAKMTLVLGSHAHVPYGSDPGEFEKTYTDQLLPFISSLNKYPRVQAALHYSGVLLHWIERSHPELFMLIEDMVVRKQIEMLGGGFYEPMLPIIPLQDKIGQIEFLTTYLRRHFGKRPQGCWIPAFAWEQSLVSPLAACGMGFTFLGERQFALAAGCGAAATGAYADAPCICEDQGKVITVFPVLQSLETALAGGHADKSVSSLLTALRDDFNKRRPEGTDYIVSIFPHKIHSGGKSKEGAWSRFFEELSRCENFVETVIPGKLVKNLYSLQKLAFPDSPNTADAVSPRRFIVVNPEAGGIYAKMVFTNVLINQLRGDKSRKLSAREELWKAQGSSLFCRIGKQGLHNRLLRNAAYSALLGAERVTREKGKFSPSLAPFDFNMDGAEEWLFRDAKINCYVQSAGGGIFEMDYLPAAWNYLDTSGGRLAFADRLLPAALNVEDLSDSIVSAGGAVSSRDAVSCGDAVSTARLCGGERYDICELDKVRRKLRLTLRPLSAGQKKIPFGTIEIEKTYVLKKDAVCVGYSLINRGTLPETFQFAPEIDLALPGEGDAFTRFFACKSTQADAALSRPVLHGADGLKIHDIKNEVQINLTANQPFDGKISPVYVCDDETGEKLYQALCIMPLFPVSLEPDGKWEIEFTLKFSH